MGKLIDSDALIEHLMRTIEASSKEEDYTEGFNDGLDFAASFASTLPSVQPERKTGKWVEHHEPFTWMGYAYWTCSECNFGEKEENKTRSKYCPNCGADMRGDQNK